MLQDIEAIRPLFSATQEGFWPYMSDIGNGARPSPSPPPQVDINCDIPNPTNPSPNVEQRLKVAGAKHEALLQGSGFSVSGYLRIMGPVERFTEGEGGGGLGFLERS